MANLALLPRAGVVEEEDDYCNVLGLSYPPMIFEGLHAPDDAHLLKAAVAVLYALALSVNNTLTLVSFDHVEVLPEPAREYRLSMTVAHDTLIHYEAWNDLFTSLATRLHGIAIEPFYDIPHGRALLRINVQILSLLNPVPRLFAQLRRRQHSVILSRITESAALQSDVIRAQRDVARGAHREELLEERLRDLRRLCSSMTRIGEGSRSGSGSSTIYSFDLNYTVTPERDRVLWALPASSALDVSALYKLTNDFSDWIIDATTGLRIQERPAGQPPLLQVLVTLYILPIRKHSIAFNESRLVVYYEGAAAAAGKKKGATSAPSPWTLAMSGPDFASHYTTTPGASGVTPAAASAAAAAARKKKLPATPRTVRTIGMGDHAPAPLAAATTPHKRHRNENEEEEEKEAKQREQEMLVDRQEHPVPSTPSAKRARYEIRLAPASPTPLMRVEEDILTQDDESVLRSIQEAESRAAQAQHLPVPNAAGPPRPATSLASRLWGMFS
jgi:hypothetical protein